MHLLVFFLNQPYHINKYHQRLAFLVQVLCIKLFMYLMYPVKT